MLNGTKYDTKAIWKLLEEVMDPEVPVLSVLDLGIVRDIKIDGDEVKVMITPTYSGCPAMDVIAISIRMRLLEYGFREVKIEQVLSPAWTTDWMSEEGKIKLKEYGIAPPHGKAYAMQALFADEIKPECPQCGSTETRMVSEFGSTACKALYVCTTCQEPFDYFKCL